MLYCRLDVEAMQSSQRIAMPMPSAISSLVLASSAFGASAVCAIPENAFMTSGAPPRRLRNCALSTFVVSGQSSYMDISNCSFRGECHSVNPSALICLNLYRRVHFYFHGDDN